MLFQLLPLALLFAASSAQDSVTIQTITPTFLITSSSGPGELTVQTSTSPLVINTISDASEIIIQTLASAGTLSVVATSSSPFGQVTPFPQAPSLVDAVSSVDQASTLLSLLQQSRFSERLTQFGSVGGTILAPTNDAFEEFLQTEAGQRFQDDDEFANALLEYHALLGSFSSDGFPETDFLGSQWFETLLYNESARPQVGGYNNGAGITLLSGFLEESQVVQADLEYQNGYIHLIDRVLTLPPSLPDALIANNFTSLAGALEASTLQFSDLIRLGGITLFAPTNQAFQAIGSALPSLAAEDITNILQYHAVPNLYFASDLEDGDFLPTLGGGLLTVTIPEEGVIFINGARVVMPLNIPALDAVVHGIDQVLNPNNANATPPASASMGVPQFSGAMSVSNVPLTSGQPTPTTMMNMPSYNQTGNASYTGPASTSSGAFATFTGGSVPMMSKVSIGGMLLAGGMVIAAI